MTSQLFFCINYLLFQVLLPPKLTVRVGVGGQTMKLTVATLTALLATVSLAVPATAQRAHLPRIPIIRSESQDFFRQGREQFEQEIRFLVWKSYFPKEDLLKINELPPLEDGPFSVERSNIFRTNVPNSEVGASLNDLSDI